MFEGEISARWALRRALSPQGGRSEAISAPEPMRPSVPDRARRLEGLLLARRLSRLALSRVRSNFHTSLLWNSLFLAGGLLGLLRPGLSALLHNATTAAIAVNSVRPFLPVLHEPPELSSADGKA